MTANGNSRDRGTVLINALVIMALLSGAVIALQARSIDDIARAQVQSDAAQASLYLDSANALAALALKLDKDLTETDHLAEDWARTDIVVPIDRGIISVQVADLQGRFNLTPLATATDDSSLPAAFVRLADSVDIPKLTAERIITHVIRNTPLGGLDALGEVSVFKPAERAALMPLITLLPENPAVNVNTAPEQVLAAQLPQLTPEALDELIGQRSTAPFETPEQFVEHLSKTLTPEQLAEVPTGRFAVSTRYFSVRATVILGQSTWSRETWLERSAEDDKVRRIYQASLYQ